MHSNRQLSNLARIFCRINKQFFGCVVVVAVLFTRFGIKFVSMVKPRGKVRVRQPFWERVTVETILSTRITSIVRNVMLLSESFLHFNNIAFKEKPYQLVSPNSQSIFRCCCCSTRFFALRDLWYYLCDHISKESHCDLPWKLIKWAEHWHQMKYIYTLFWNVCFSVNTFFFFLLLFAIDSSAQNNNNKKKTGQKPLHGVKQVIYFDISSPPQHFSFVCKTLFTLAKQAACNECFFSHFWPDFQEIQFYFGSHTQ